MTLVISLVYTFTYPVSFTVDVFNRRGNALRKFVPTTTDVRLKVCNACTEEVVEIVIVTLSCKG